MVEREHVVAAHRAVVDAPTQRIAIVTLGDHQLAQIDRHTAQRVVHDVDDVGHLLASGPLPNAMRLEIVDLVLPFLNLTFEQINALLHIHGELFARALDLHDDRIHLRTGQRHRALLKRRQRLDGSMGTLGQAAHEPVLAAVDRIGHPRVVSGVLGFELLQYAPGGHHVVLALTQGVGAIDGELANRLAHARQQSLLRDFGGEGSKQTRSMAM